MVLCFEKIAFFIKKFPFSQEINLISKFSKCSKIQHQSSKNHIQLHVTYQFLWIIIFDIQSIRVRFLIVDLENNIYTIIHMNSLDLSYIKLIFKAINFILSCILCRKLSENFN